MNTQFIRSDDALSKKRSRKQFQMKTKCKPQDTVDKQIENKKQEQDKEVAITKEKGTQETAEENRERLAKELERIRRNQLITKDNRKRLAKELERIRRNQLSTKDNRDGVPKETKQKRNLKIQDKRSKESLEVANLRKQKRNAKIQDKLSKESLEVANLRKQKRNVLLWSNLSKNIVCMYACMLVLRFLRTRYRM